MRHSGRALSWPQRGNRLVWGLGLGVAALLLARFGFAPWIELLPEEAYYWMYSAHPALSYYDHPPMVAWVIRGGTVLLGHTELGVRLLTLLLGVGSCGLLYRLGRSWFDRRTAQWTVLLFALIPLYGGIGFFAMPDGPLVFFWLACVYALSQAMDVSGQAPAVLPGSSRWRQWRSTLYWLAAGLAFGGALLSKYTAVMLAPSLVLFWWLSPRHRHWWRRPQPWLAMVVALLVFAPVLVWNAQNQWASLLFQSTRTVGQRHQPWRNHLLFWLTQLGVLTPLVFGLLAAALRRGWRELHTPQAAPRAMALAFSVPLFLLFALASFKVQVHLNWTAPAFLALLPVAAHWFVGKLAAPRPGQPGWWRRLGWATVAIGSLVSIGGLGLLAGNSHLPWGYTRAGAWHRLAHAVELAEHQLEAETGQRAFVLALDKYNVAAELGFYSAKPGEHINNYAVGGHGLGFRYWTDLRAWEGHPALVVLRSTNEATLAKLTRHFDRIGPARPLLVAGSLTQRRTFYVAHGYGYRPQPQPATGSPAR